MLSNFGLKILVAGGRQRPWHRDRMAGLGYRFDSVEVTAVWRYLDYDLGDNTPITSIDFNGPALGFTFRF